MSIQSVRRALMIFEAVAEKQPCGVTELSRQLGMHKATVQRFLLALAEAGWIRTDGQEITRWILTGRALAVGGRVGSGGHLREVATPVISRLAADTGESAWLSVQDGYEMVLLLLAESRHAMRVTPAIGSRGPLHDAGRPILAALPQAEVDMYLGHMRATESTETVSAFVRELEEIRRRGHAIIEHTNYVTLSTCVRAAGERPIAAVGISAPRVRLEPSRYREYVHKIAIAAHVIADALVGRPSIGP